jgi:glycosyltransferase involved in cell wall biosynthesis
MSGAIESDGKSPLVSVIVRTYGQRRHLLKECLQSVAAQEYRKIEIVVVEDGSAESQACVEQFRDTTDLAVQYHSIAKAGRCRAGNKGLESASGSLLNFLDDDDQLYPQHVGLLAAKLRSRPDLAAAYTLSLEVPMSIQSYDPLVYTLQPGRPFRGGPFSLGRLCSMNFLPIQSVMFRRELFLRHGGFDVELDRLEDWNLWIRYFTDANAEFVDEVTSFFRVPVASRERLQRNASIDRYYPLALEKLRETLARAGVARTGELQREMQHSSLARMPLPAGVRRWIEEGHIRRALVVAGLKYANRAAKAARRLLAGGVWSK